MQVLETMLANFGSRFTLHFLPRQKQIRLSPLGKYYDLAWHCQLGFKVGAESRYLPFAGADLPPFPEIEMELGMSSVTFRAQDRQLGLTVTFKFTAPFYPQDETVCLAPYIYLDITLNKVPANKNIELLTSFSPVSDSNSKISFRQASDGLDLPLGAIVQAEYAEIPEHWGPKQKHDALSGQKFELPFLFALYNYPTGLSPFPTITSTDFNLRLAGDLQVGQEFNFLLATHVAEPVLEIKGEPYVFKYTRLYSDLVAVYNQAVANHAAFIAKTTQFEEIFRQTSLGKTNSDFLAFAFQSYVPNTWWTVAANNPATDWFSVWEGNCAFHSTVDVEYNLAWFYLLLWPELLEKTLAEWRGYLQQDERGEWLSHDIGGLLGANGQTYGHPMEIEENCNFILLTYALWRFSGKAAVQHDNRAVVARLIQFVLDSDTTGNGFPNRGIANTIDDASPAVQFGREQTYLAVKALSACWAASFILENVENSENNEQHKVLSQKCYKRVILINQTLNARAWLDDHYAVTLDRTTAGLHNPWTGTALPPGELEGWDAYSLYTSNGLLYLLASGANLPPGDYARYTQDVAQSAAASLIEYGCTHSSYDKSNIWVSQNLHRDFTAAYLGLDLSSLLERYWAFEQFENSQGRGGCFVDTYGANHLHYYPRGLTSLGSLWALAGLRLDKLAGTLEFNPVRVPLRVPLLPFADWKTGRLPWLNFWLQNNRVAFEIENSDLLGNLKVGLGLPRQD